MARPEPCLGCGTELDETGALTIAKALPLECSSGLLRLKWDPATLELDGSGRLKVIPPVIPPDSYYPMIFSEAYPSVYPLITGALITPVGVTSLLSSGDVSISITNPTNKPYVCFAQWRFWPRILTGATSMDYWVGPNVTILKEGVAIGTTSTQDGVRVAKVSTGAHNLYTEVNTFTGLTGISPGETYSLTGNISYSIGVAGTSSDGVGTIGAYFRVVGYPQP